MTPWTLWGVIGASLVLGARSGLAAENTPAGLGLESAVLSLQAEIQASQQLEGLLITFIQIFDEQLSRQAEGKTELHREYTEQEFQDLIARRLEERFRDRILEIDLDLHPDRLVASGQLLMESRRYRIEIQLGLRAVEERPFTEVHQVRVESHTFSQQNRELLQARVNGQIRRLPLSLRLKEISLKEGWASVTAALTG